MAPKSDVINVENITPNLTINTMIDNTKQQMGNQMFQYNAINNNCQIFVRNILNYNGMYDEKYNDFIMQDVETVFRGLNGSKSIMGAFLNVANRSDIMMHGQDLMSEFKHKKPE